ncbi:unnamed protein product [Moneuplotes crassus]|uniref:Uncharacterized protein n=1 Tax=Euplotes crassus TaxID=5936 RepID=A0AAD1UB73_EUPCR|nr:unnamed protein product [Moneuplotes crassus]
MYVSRILNTPEQIHIGDRCSFPKGIYENFLLNSVLVSEVSVKLLYPSESFIIFTAKLLGQFNST